MVYDSDMVNLEHKAVDKDMDPSKTDKVVLKASPVVWTDGVGLIKEMWQEMLKTDAVLPHLLDDGVWIKVFIDSSEAPTTKFCVNI